MNQMPIFVRVEEYNDVLSLVKTIKNKLEDAKLTLQKIHDLKNEEDHQLELWRSTLAEIEGKVSFIDRSLNEPEQF